MKLSIHTYATNQSDLNYLCFDGFMYVQPEESQLAKITRDSSKITVEQVHGLMSQVTKHPVSHTAAASIDLHQHLIKPGLCLCFPCIHIGYQGHSV